MGVAELKKLIDDAREELQRKQKQCHDSENEKIKMKKEFEDQMAKIQKDFNEVSKASLGDSKALVDKIEELEQEI